MPTCGAVSAGAVVMGLMAVLALVLGLVLARLWWQRRGSRFGEVARWFQARGTPACTSVMRAISVLDSRPVVGTLSVLIAWGNQGSSHL